MLTFTRVEEKLDALMQWISPIEPRKRHHDIVSKRLNGTGHWFLETEDFCNWRGSGSMDDTAHSRSRNRVFGCYGKPGAGKSIIGKPCLPAISFDTAGSNVISSLVIDHLVQISQVSNSGDCVVWFYCDYRDDKQETEENILGALLKQLLWQTESNATVLS
jgi:hypothetical protein